MFIDGRRTVALVRRRCGGKALDAAGWCLEATASSEILFNQRTEEVVWAAHLVS